MKITVLSITFLYIMEAYSNIFYNVGVSKFPARREFDVVGNVRNTV